MSYNRQVTVLGVDPYSGRIKVRVHGMQTSVPSEGIDASRLAVLEEKVDTIMGKGDTTENIDTLPEIVNFLKEQKNTETLKNVTQVIINDTMEEKSQLTEEQMESIEDLFKGGEGVDVPQETEGLTDEQMEGIIDLFK